MNCGFIGDSIALGLAMLNPHCDVTAVRGRPTSVIAQHVPKQHYDWAVISAGSNDYNSPVLRTNLSRIRNQVRAENVVWVIPKVSKRAAQAVIATANQHGDRTVTIGLSSDRVHPLSYFNLWSAVKRIVKGF